MSVLRRGGHPADAGDAVSTQFIETSCLRQRHSVYVLNGVYGDGAPKLWTETIDAHSAAALDAMALLVADHGLVALGFTRS
jgi:ribulose-5-phosphate 4-epimerase/fuculose-1-phosphate aldolase